MKKPGIETLSFSRHCRAALVEVGVFPGLFSRYPSKDAVVIVESGDLT